MAAGPAGLDVVGSRTPGITDEDHRIIVAAAATEGAHHAKAPARVRREVVWFRPLDPG